MSLFSAKYYFAFFPSKRSVAMAVFEFLIELVHQIQGGWPLQRHSGIRPAESDPLEVGIAQGLYRTNRNELPGN